MSWSLTHWKPPVWNSWSQPCMYIYKMLACFVLLDFFWKSQLFRVYFSTAKGMCGNCLFVIKVGDLMRSFKLLVYKAEKSALEEVDVMVHVDGYKTLFHTMFSTVQHVCYRYRWIQVWTQCSWRPLRWSMMRRISELMEGTSSFVRKTGYFYMCNTRIWIFRLMCIDLCSYLMLSKILHMFYGLGSTLTNSQISIYHGLKRTVMSPFWCCVLILLSV